MDGRVAFLVKDILIKLHLFLDTHISLSYVILALIVVVTLSLFLIIRQRKNIRMIKRQSETVNNILTNFRSEKGLEKNLSDFLDLIIPLVKAEGYYFYLFDQKSSNFILKAVRHNNSESANIEPSYSGLVPYKKENYNPPLGLPAQDQPTKPVVLKDGQVPLLVLPVRGGAGLIRVGPVSRVSKETLVLMEYLGEKFQSALDMVVEIEKMRSQVESVNASSKAVRSLTKSALDMDDSLATIMGLSVKIIDAPGGILLFMADSRLEPSVVMGLDKEVEDMFRQDREGQSILYQLGAGKEFLLINREMKEFLSMPAYFSAMGMDTILLLSVPGKVNNGLAIFWFNKVTVIEQHRFFALQMLVRRIGEALDRQFKFKELSNSYIDFLKTLVYTVDNLEQYTISHSEIISRYAGIISREMKVADSEIRDIMLAGYLHDLGMLGLSGDILFKTGKYTGVEYETMKLHAEIGASIIESTISNSRLASYIRHHHERWDGFGYPTGLKKEEIPLGARIISVADMFNAKLTGRKNREPASFERAVNDIRAASGTQLDPAPVEALIGWFRKKQSKLSKKGGSLGPCWDMRCCPRNISSACPAYKMTDKNCWEIEGVNCAAHGNSCSSCMVYTEFMYRTGQTAAMN